MVAATSVLKRGGEELPHIQIRDSSQEELPYYQGKEQRLCFAGAAVKRYPTSKVRETQVSRCCKRAPEGRHTETIITEN